jgi:hypothetical protein
MARRDPVEYTVKVLRRRARGLRALAEDFPYSVIMPQAQAAAREAGAILSDAADTCEEEATRLLNASRASR